jgi:hypothetical protein
MDAETLRLSMEVEQAWEPRVDGLWLDAPGIDVLRMAHLMGEAGARLMTITARPNGDQETRLAYHWDLDGQVLTVITLTDGTHIASISSICPAANWIEREIHDYYGVVFTGHEDPSPLVLRPGDQPGLFHWNGQQGGER